MLLGDFIQQSRGKIWTFLTLIPSIYLTGSNVRSFSVSVLNQTFSPKTSRFRVSGTSDIEEGMVDSTIPVP